MSLTHFTWQTEWCFWSDNDCAVSRYLLPLVIKLLLLNLCSELEKKVPNHANGLSRCHTKGTGACGRVRTFFGMTPTFQFFFFFEFVFFLWGGVKSVSYQKSARPSFGMTLIQAIRDLFAQRSPDCFYWSYVVDSSGRFKSANCCSDLHI